MRLDCPSAFLPFMRDEITVHVARDGEEVAVRVKACVSDPDTSTGVALAPSGWNTGVAFRSEDWPEREIPSVGSTIEPDTVWLYGNPSTLSQITEVTTLPAHLTQLNDSCLITLALDPVWQRHDGLRTSTDSIRLFLPIDRYVEKSFTVPVRFDGADNQMQVKLHPDRADVTLWVPVRDYDKITSDMVHLAVNYIPDDNSQTLPVRATLFPSGTRVKHISPSSIQYVIIR